MSVYIFGAKATAAGFYRALSFLKPERKVEAFIVSKKEDNVSAIWGCPVKTISDVTQSLSGPELDKAEVYVAVPELAHREIRELLESNGFKNLIMIDSGMEAKQMGQYYDLEGRYHSIHSLDPCGEESRIPVVTVYAASFYKDKPLSNKPIMAEYVKRIYLGCAGALREGIDISGQADFYDNEGDNISEKNPNRCEMTAHYWVWKNRLNTEDEYVGIYHYRRILDLTEEDLKKMKANDVDVVLPYPMIHYPNAAIQHTWYVPERDWELMKKVVWELYPAYGEKFDEIFSAPEFYNYNMMLAKKKVFADYCAWLYPILDRIEELSEPKGIERRDRYTAYMSESLETLYFMANLKGLKIFHTGRILFV